MTGDREQDLERICHAALERPVAERASYVAEACGGDEVLQHAVESLLAQDGAAASFLGTPALAVAAHELVERDARALSPPGPALAVGQQVGPYTVLSPLGSGGMGEVYRAHDAALGREVAIKVLPSLFTRDPERLARLEREARLLASLNHPNIATIHGVEHADGIHAMVLEVVEGETLAERLQSTASDIRVRRRRGTGSTQTRAGLPLADALTIARQIAEALEAAHEKGVIHRDLKPANVKIRPDGVVKVLDFGLARAVAPASSHADGSPPRSHTTNGTRDGAVLGTAAYMSPEQARGQPVDKRTDIWAFGCVVFEMLTGLNAFAGETLTDTLAAIVEREPPWTVLPDTTPPAIRHLLERCLEKDPKRRLRDIGDARVELEGGQSGAPLASAVPHSASRLRLAWLSALLLFTLAATATGIWAFRSPAPAPEVRFTITTPPTKDLAMAMAPDGQTVVFIADSEGGPRLWLHSLVSGSARPLVGTEGASSPFWSPDSRAVGFFADDKLKRIDVGGGSAQVVADAKNAWGGAWGRDGTILFGMSTGEPIVRVSATGGDPKIVTPRGQPGLKAFPRLLPDGRHFLFFVWDISEEGVDVGQIEGGETRRLFAADSPAVYAASGHLLFVRQGRLFAQNFDAGRLQLTGSPFVVAGAPPISGALLRGQVSVSTAGPLAYRPGWIRGGAPRQLLWFDRSGRAIENAGDPVHSGWANPALSPDGRRVAVWRTVSGNGDIWAFDLRRHVIGRLTSDAALDNNPVWSPDGARIVYSSYRKDVLDLYQISADGAGPEELLLTTPQIKGASDWSRDGRFLLYTSVDPRRRNDIWALPMGRDRTPFPVVQTNFNEDHGQFSPDGAWVAYQSDESGRDEIYVQPFPGPGSKLQVSTGGGVQVRWRQDGRELFYLALDGRLMAVPIQLSSRAETPNAGAPVSLFLTRVFAVQGTNIRQQYMVSPDGQRFLVDSETAVVESPITVILNWKPKP